MNTKLFTRIFFSVFVFALGAWAFYEYKKSQQEEVQKTEEALFLKKELKNLKAIRIQKNKEQLEALKEDKKWLVKAPVKDLADWKEISRWFDEITNQKVQKLETSKEKNWKEYNLDGAPYVEIEFSSGETVSFSVSRQSSFDGKYFIKKGEELFIGEAHFSREVNEKDFDSFRSKKLLPSLGHAIKIQFHGKENFTLNWTDYKWSLSSQKTKTFPLDADRLDGFWTDLSSMDALSIKEAVTPSSLKKYHLNKPQLEIQLSYPNEETNLMLKLSPFKEEKAFVSLSHRDFIMEISKSEAEKLLLSQKDIRDHAFPFNYNTDLVEQIERKNKGKSFLIKKSTEGWQSLDDKTKKPDTEKVSELLDKIKNLRGEKYKAGSIQKSNRRIEIKKEGEEILFELKEQASSDKSHSWIKTNLWEELVAVSKTDLDAVFEYSIIPEKKKEESTKKGEDNTTVEKEKHSKEN